MPLLIRTTGLTKSYTTGDQEVFAVRDVDLEVAQGEFTVLMGSSGSGKSSLLYLLSGLERATSGEILFQEQRVDLLDETELALLRRTGIGFVFQAINLVPQLTLFENIVVPGYLADSNRESVDRRAEQLLESLGIGELAQRLPAQVSGGEQQRAAIARAMVSSPQALLADEPTGALNSSAGEAVLQAFREINAAGQTILMATHEVRAACFGDRVLYMRDGAIRSEHRFDSPADADIDKREPALVKWLSTEGW